MPLDAYKMDFVFSDVESGDGTYDSRGGYDYHLPVEDSAVRYIRVTTADFVLLVMVYGLILMIYLKQPRIAMT